MQSTENPSANPVLEPELRQKILAAPELLLEDPEVMRALVGANDRVMGGNIVDMRGIAMERLEARLDRLEDTHRSVIAAAYDNLAGTQQIHRAILRLLEPAKFEEFLEALGTDVAAILRVDAIQLILESKLPADDNVARYATVLTVAQAGFAATYLGGPNAKPRAHLRTVTLRPLPDGHEVYGDLGPDIRSEACLRLDLGEGRLPGLLLLGARDPETFSAKQGTDLMTFFATVFERVMRRWLDA